MTSERLLRTLEEVTKEVEETLTQLTDRIDELEAEVTDLYGKLGDEEDDNSFLAEEVSRLEEQLADCNKRPCCSSERVGVK